MVGCTIGIQMHGIFITIAKDFHQQNSDQHHFLEEDFMRIYLNIAKM